MRKDIHPNYQEVLFHDTNADVFFLTRSTVNTKATREYEGKEYPYYPLDISSASHPFYTGEQRKTSTEAVLQASTNALVRLVAVARKLLNNLYLWYKYMSRSSLLLSNKKPLTIQRFFLSKF